MPIAAFGAGFTFQGLSRYPLARLNSKNRLMRSHLFWEEHISNKANHVDRVLASVSSGSAAARSRLAASWQRSHQTHGLDPGQTGSSERLEQQALRLRREALEEFLRIANPKLDSLFGLVGHSGCGVLLTDADGIVLEQRCTDADTGIFRKWGLWPGADWSEAREGTNGIGTCLTEQRQVIIHRDDHFLARNIGMSCMDAPIFGPEGDLIAALDVSSARADQTETFNALIAATVSQTAQLIEAEIFRTAFRGLRIIVTEAGSPSGASLVAVDDDDIIVGATRVARKAFGFKSTGPLAALPASDILGNRGGPKALERAERAAVMRALARSGGNVSEAARALGIGRATLYRRMNRLDISQSG